MTKQDILNILANRKNDTEIIFGCGGYFYDGYKGSFIDKDTGLTIINSTKIERNEDDK